jgi:hypothetical protein
VQYTFGIYTIALAIAGGVSQLIASEWDERSRPGIEDADQLGELTFKAMARQRGRAVDRRSYGLCAGAWFSLSIGLVISAVLSSLVINFPWYYQGGIVCVAMSVGVALIPLIRYYASRRPRLLWLRGLLTDESFPGFIFEHTTLLMIDEKSSPKSAVNSVQRKMAVTPPSSALS